MFRAISTKAFYTLRGQVRSFDLKQVAQELIRQSMCRGGQQSLGGRRTAMSSVNRLAVGQSIAHIRLSGVSFIRQEETGHEHGTDHQTLVRAVDQLSGRI